MTERCNVLVLGLPGSGKSTLCATLATNLPGVEWLAASEVLRRHAEKMTDDGGWTQAWAQGRNAPDSEVLPVLWHAFEEHTCTTLILDGYPRTFAQLVDLVKRGGQLALAIHLRLDMEAAATRIRARSVNSSRPDLSPSIVDDRLRSEARCIDALLQASAIRSVLHELDASRPPEVIARESAELIDQYPVFPSPTSAH